MLVKILKPVVYAPRAGDARRTYGQLRCRPAVRTVDIARPDGSTFAARVSDGPMEYFFPAGRTPEIPDDVASEWIAAGLAEPCELPASEQRVAAEIMQEMV